MPSMHKFKCLSLTVLVLAFFTVSVCESAVKKPVVKAPVLKAPVAVPKVLTAVAGQPFETVPASGSSKLSVTLCPEETAAFTFSVKSSKPLNGVKVIAGDITGPGKLDKTDVSVRMVVGQNLLPCDSIDIGSMPVQLWANAIAPKNAKAGTYNGSIAFLVQGKVVDRVPVQYIVLPLRLIGSSKQYALYTRLGPGAEGPNELSGDGYAKFLTSAAKLGFRAVSVNADLTRTGEAFAACVSAGLVGTAPVLDFAWGSTVPSEEQVKSVEDSKKSTGIPSVYLFCGDNPSGESEIAACLQRADLLRQARYQVGATVCDEAVAAKLLPSLDGVNYNYDMPYVQALIGGGTNRTNKWEWYWWDARESVAKNRIYSGIALWKSGLYGCMPMWTPDQCMDNASSLNSLLCEALREGINDTRYLTSYMKALRELKDKKREPDKQYIAASEAYLSNFLAKPFDKMTPAELRVFRERITEFSIKLAARL